MTKNDLANKLAARTGVTVAKATEAIESLMEIAMESFELGHNIYLRGFGTLKVVSHKAKVAQNISKREPIMVPAHRSVKFIASPVLKERLK